MAFACQGKKYPLDQKMEVDRYFDLLKRFYWQAVCDFRLLSSVMGAARNATRLKAGSAICPKPA